MSKPFAPPESAVPEPSSGREPSARAPPEEARARERTTSSARGAPRVPPRARPDRRQTRRRTRTARARSGRARRFASQPRRARWTRPPRRRRRSALRAPDARRRRAASGPPEAEMSMSEYRGRCTGTHFSAPRVRSDSTRLGSWPEPRLSRTSAGLARRRRRPSSRARVFVRPAEARTRRVPAGAVGFPLRWFLRPRSAQRVRVGHQLLVPPSGAARPPVPRPFSEFCRDAAFPPLSVLEKECCRIASCIFISLARVVWRGGT